ncbi:hypothetical protein FH972_010286 [Carpinus fangiana]|uniref:Uncharacterized protein n=1 Tax=Carpinus fangiana TaxID=176857 RepID=A0A660KPR8_9ROSI|nr:hypothetical protein FH972_010286 [Carpinus fangiana]
MEKESNNVEAIKGKFDKFSTPTREAWIPRRKGENIAGDSDGAHAEDFPKNKLSSSELGGS